MNIDGHTELQLVPIFLLQVSVRELHNSLISDPVDGGIKEAKGAENNSIISDYTLRSLLTPQLKKCHQDTRLCVIVNVVYMLKLHIHNYYHGVIVLKKKHQIQNSQNRRSGEKANSHI